MIHSLRHTPASYQIGHFTLKTQKNKQIMKRDKNKYLWQCLLWWQEIIAFKQNNFELVLLFLRQYDMFHLKEAFERYYIAGSNMHSGSEHPIKL